MNNFAIYLGVFWICSLLYGSPPQITITQSIISPRLNLFNDQSVNRYFSEALDDTIHFRTYLDYQQEIWHGFKIYSQLDYGSENYRFDNSFRIHSLYSEIQHNGHKLKLGRINHWNSLVNRKYDGANYSLKTNNFGSFTLAGGIVPSYIETDPDESDPLFFITSWGIQKKSGFKLATHFWGDILDDDEKDNPFKIGFTVSGNSFLNIRFKGMLSWNITENDFYYSRIYLSKNLGEHKLSFTLRQKQIDVNNIYPWLEETLWVSPTATIGFTSRFQNFYTYHKIGVKFTEETNAYFSTAVSWSKFQLQFTAGQQADNLFIGGGISAIHDLTKTIKLGCCISANTMDYDDIIETKSSFGTNGWLQWQPCKNVVVKIFGRYQENPYYSENGRGGLNVSYSI